MVEGENSVHRNRPVISTHIRGMHTLTHTCVHPYAHTHINKIKFCFMCLLESSLSKVEPFVILTQ